MAAINGQNLVVSFDGNSLEADYRELQVSEEMGLADASAGADQARSYLTTLEDGTATLSLLMPTDAVAATDAPQALAKGTEGTLEWGPEGTTTGKPKVSVNAIVQSYEERYPYDDVVEVTASFQFSGPLTRSTYA